MIAELEEKVMQTNAIEGINHGGCAINALAIYDYVMLHYPELNPVIMYHHSCSYNDNAIYVKKGQYQYLCCGHAIVKIEVDGYIQYVESSGVWDDPRCDGEPSLKEHKLVEVPRDMVSMHINTSGWNKCFDRRNSVRIDEIFGTKVAWEVEGVIA